MINDADNEEEVVKDALKTILVGKGTGLFSIMLKFHSHEVVEDNRIIYSKSLEK